MATINEKLQDYILKRQVVGSVSTDINTPFYDEPIRNRTKFFNDFINKEVVKSLGTGLSVLELFNNDDWDNNDNGPSTKNGDKFSQLYPHLNIEFYKNFKLTPVKKYDGDNVKGNDLWKGIDAEDDNILEYGLNFNHSTDDSFLPILSYDNKTKTNNMFSEPLFWMYNDVNGTVAMFNTNAILNNNNIDTSDTDTKTPYFTFFRYIGDKGFNNLVMNEGCKLETGNMIITEGNVGIGTESPDTTLDVGGQVYIKGSRTNASARTVDGNTGQLIISESGGQNLTLSDYQIHCNNTNGLYINAADSGGIRFMTSTDTKMYLKHNGNFGIGTINPDAKLDVLGDISCNRIISNESDPINASFFASGSKIPNTGYNRILEGPRPGTSSGGALHFINSSTRNNDGGPSTYTIRNENGDLSLGGKYNNIGINGIYIKGENGKVGMGTDSPDEMLHLNDGNIQLTKTKWSSGEIRKIIGDKNGKKRIEWVWDNNCGTRIIDNENIGFYVGGSETERMRIDTNGNVGIGTNDPGVYKLNVSGSIILNDEIFLRDPAQTAHGDRIYGKIAVDGQSEDKDCKINFYTGGGAPNLAMTIKGENVGIGTDSPNTKLDVRGNVRIGDGTTDEQDINFVSANGNWKVGSNVKGNGTNSNQFYIYDTTYRLTVQKGTGNVGIGTNNPGAKLTLKGDGGGEGLCQIYFDNTRDNGNSRHWHIGPYETQNTGLFQIYPGTARNNHDYSASKTFCIDYNGNVGIGKDNQSSKLDVDGSIRASYDSDSTSYFGRAAIGHNGWGDYASFAHVNSNTKFNYALKHSRDGATYINAATGKSLHFRINNVDKMILDATSFYPNVNSSYNLGTDDKRWNLYANTINVISVQVEGSIRASYDSNSTSYFGRAAIGYNGWNDYASFAHLDANTKYKYALKHSSDGATYINAATGKSLHFRINNVDKMILDATSFYPNSSGYDLGTTGKRWEIYATSINANTKIDVQVASSSATAEVNIYGNGYSTGRLYVGQDMRFGGGIEYNGDNSPATSGSGADYITLYRRLYDTNYWTARNFHTSNDWQFRGGLTCTSLNAGSGTIQTTGQLIGGSTTINGTLTATSSTSKFSGISCTGNITADGDITVNSTDSVHNFLKVNYDTGNGVNTIGVEIGPGNDSYCHYTTDRPTHWFNKQIDVNGSILAHGSNRNLGSSSGHRFNIYATSINANSTITASGKITGAGLQTSNNHIYDSGGSYKIAFNVSSSPYTSINQNTNINGRIYASSTTSSGIGRAGTVNYALCCGSKGIYTDGDVYSQGKVTSDTLECKSYYSRYYGATTHYFAVSDTDITDWTGYTSTSIFAAKYISSDAGFIATSDKRIKYDIADISNNYCLDVINSIKIKKYKYKDERYREDSEFAKSDASTIGFIAQNVLKYLPQAVKMRTSDSSGSIINIKDIIISHEVINNKLFIYSKHLNDLSEKEKIITRNFNYEYLNVEYKVNEEDNEIYIFLCLSDIYITDEELFIKAIDNYNNEEIINIPQIISKSNINNNKLREFKEYLYQEGYIVDSNNKSYALLTFKNIDIYTNKEYNLKGKKLYIKVAKKEDIIDKTYTVGFIDEEIINDEKIYKIECLEEVDYNFKEILLIDKIIYKDILTLKKDVIFAIHHGGIQEHNKMIKNNETEIETLKTENELLKTENNTLKDRLSAIEARLLALENNH